MSDVAVEFALYPPDDVDLEFCAWTMFPTNLYQAGLIWHGWEIRKEINNDGLTLLSWCTFCDEWAFNHWRENVLVNQRCAEVLASRIEVKRLASVSTRRKEVCLCDESQELVLFGPHHQPVQAFLHCHSCRRYHPHHRFLYQLSCFSDLTCWAHEYAHIDSIWMLTSTFNDWSERQLFDMKSELNQAGFALCQKASQELNRRVWYFLKSKESAIYRKHVNDRCPNCETTELSCVSSYLQCDSCGIMFDY